MKVTFILLLLFFGLGLWAQQMVIQLDGMINFDQSAFTISEAGSDFASNIESEASFFVTVTSGNEWDKKTNPNRKWKVEVKKEDLTWDNSIQLEIARTGDGNSQQGNKSKIYNGNTYQTVSDFSNHFFNGKGFSLAEAIGNLVMNNPNIFQISHEWDENDELTRKHLGK